jgi:hypothetical protein
MASHPRTSIPTYSNNESIKTITSGLLVDIAKCCYNLISIGYCYTFHQKANKYYTRILYELVKLGVIKYLFDKLCVQKSEFVEHFCLIFPFDEQIYFKSEFARI